MKEEGETIDLNENWHRLRTETFKVMKILISSLNMCCIGENWKFKGLKYTELAHKITYRNKFANDDFSAINHT